MSILDFLKHADYAVGIPNKYKLGDPKGLLADEVSEFLIQLHNARRAGKHFDIRLGNPVLGLLSWATKKNPFALAPGESIALYQQPLHSYSYREFEGTIPRGYGAGTVKKLLLAPVTILSVDSNNIVFTVQTPHGLKRFLISKAKKTDSDKPTWYLINTTPAPKDLPEKIKFSVLDEEEARNLIKRLGQNIASVQPKIDGALAIVKLYNDKIEVFSPRISKRSNLPIVYTERLFGTVPKVKIPEQLNNTILLGELYAVKKDRNKERILSPVELTAILNMRLPDALSKIKNEGIRFKVFLFDTVSLGKTIPADRYYTVPYEKRREIINKVIKFLPDIFHAPISVDTPQSAEQLLSEIKKRSYPLTEEGIVIFPSVGKPYKYKLYDEADVPIVGITEGTGKYKGRGIGGLVYALEEGGPPIGVVGTGLSDEFRKMIYENPEEFIGRIAKIKYQEQFPSGAFRAPVFMGFHESK